MMLRIAVFSLGPRVGSVRPSCVDNMGMAVLGHARKRTFVEQNNDFIFLILFRKFCSTLLFLFSFIFIYLFLYFFFMYIFFFYFGSVWPPYSIIFPLKSSSNFRNSEVENFGTDDTNIPKLFGLYVLS